MQLRFTTAITSVLLVSLGFACSYLRPKPQLTWHLTLAIDAAAPDREALVRRTMTVIERRLETAGVANFQVSAQGAPPDGRILVSLPDFPDRERLKKLITAAGKLEFVAVISPPSPSPVKTYNTMEEIVASLGGTIPGNRRALPFSERDELTNSELSSRQTQSPKQWVVIESTPIVDGSKLRNAVALPSRANSKDYIISFSLTPEGADSFAAWTGSHINEYLGVVLNDEVKSIAYIKSQISDQGEINGRYTKESAEDLALVLRSGTLPAPVKIIEEGANK